MLYIIIIFLILFIVYNHYNQKNKNTKINNDYLQLNNSENYANIKSSKLLDADDSAINDTIDKLINQDDEINIPIQMEDSDRELNWPNKAPTNEYVHSSYVSGIRGNDKSAILAHDEYNTSLAANLNYDKFASNDTFKGLIEVGDYQTYKSYQNKPLTTKQQYDVEKLLPGEVNKDWFEIMPDPIKVKNRHLIGISKPVGLDTVGSSRKNMSRDLRGDVLNPKRVISPWMNSSIDPDLPTVGLCNDISL